jgi:hypothetical protein
VLHHAGESRLEGLDADEAALRIGGRQRREVLARAEADLEPHLRGRVGEEGARVEAGRRCVLEIDQKLGQQPLDQGLTRRPRRLAAAPAVEGLAPPPVAQSAPRIASARSVFSQEKPPSGSGARPKWPYEAVRA